MYTLKKKLQNAAICHRLGKGYKSKCKNLHGHEYEFQIELTFNQLDQYDMGVDFGVIKEICDGWIQKNWDHACLVSHGDVKLVEFLRSEQNRYFIVDESDSNTTAEWMSRFLAETVKSLLTCRGINPYKLTMTVWETPTSSSSYTL